MSVRMLVTECFDGNHTECKGYNGPTDNPNFVCDCDCHRKQIHDDPTCPCHEFSARTPSETYYGHPRLDTGADLAVGGAGTSQSDPQHPFQPSEGLNRQQTQNRAIPVSGNEQESKQPDSPALRRTRSILHHAEMVEERKHAQLTFEQEWQSAPKSIKHGCEETSAEFFYHAGRRDRETEMLREVNEVLSGVVGRIERERVR